MRGKFLVIEGIEGLGKTTQASVIRDFIIGGGREVVHTREPGGTPMAENIRSLLLSRPNGESMAEMTELLLMFAARAQHIAQLIEPALAQGAWVLSDRFTDATYAYQGYGRAMSIKTISALEQLVQGSLRPDLTILLDAPVSVSQKRAAARGKLDRFELEAAEFFARAREGYLARAAASLDRFLVVNAEQSIEAVSGDIIIGLTRWMERCASSSISTDTLPHSAATSLAG